MTKEEVKEKNLELDIISYVSKFSQLKTEISTLNELFANRLLMIKVIEKGMPSQLFDMLNELSSFSISNWSNILDLSPKSIQNYSKQNKQFDSMHSEKIFQFSEINEIGKNVFGNKDKFKLWLETPNYALGNSKPVDLLKYSYGKEMVLEELGRIEHGILA